jgi:hypothetical protein
MQNVTMRHCRFVIGCIISIACNVTEKTKAAEAKPQPPKVALPNVHKVCELDRDPAHCTVWGCGVPRPCRYYAQVSALLNPSRLPTVIRDMIAEYVDWPRLWKCAASILVEPYTACTYIPTSAVGPLLVVGNAKTHNIQFLRCDDGKEVAAQLTGHKESISQLVYSKMNGILISTADAISSSSKSRDTSLRLWIYL